MDNGTKSVVEFFPRVAGERINRQRRKSIICNSIIIEMLYSYLFDSFTNLTSRTECAYWICRSTPRQNQNHSLRLQ
jgi:hypothetical protein